MPLMMSAAMDLNADLGEGCAGDAALMPLIQRANIACGGHAGDEQSMRETILRAMHHQVLIGAHPSYPDRARFGRIETGDSPADIRRYCTAQLNHFVTIAKDCGATVAHVKPHGALYHRVMSDPLAARALIGAVTATVGQCALMGLPGSVLQQETESLGLPFVAEMFADRRYEADGSLTPRQHPEALIRDIDEALAQVRSVRERGKLKSRTGAMLTLHADTVCVHGDGEHALALATALHGLLKDA